MAGGWRPASSTAGVRQDVVAFPLGDAKDFAIDVPGKDLTGWDAQWLLGVPPNPAFLGLLSTSYTPPNIAVMKATGANLNIVTVDGGSSLRFSLTYSDTIGLQPRPYWQQAIVIDPMGNPYTVAEGPVNLTPSLRAVQFAAADPMPLSIPAQDSFAVWQGDDTPPKTWGYGLDSAPTDLTGSTFVLTVTGASTPISVRSDDGSNALPINLATGTVQWNYTKAQSASIPPSGATYQLRRLINGTTQLWAHGSVVGLTP
ncbi:hypothetical protein ACQKQD_18620 [Methylobacterium sp. NPDC080182]|uniref:hypothetical protein n=1 Tax=Methylobacterium sp. NPDC080182 TaxID=3390590 RepID=UPI003D091916